MYRSGSNKKNNIEELEALLGEFSDDHSDMVRLGHEIGAENLTKVMDVLGGLKKHIPSGESFHTALLREKRDEKVRQKFKGNNYTELSDEFQLSEESVRLIVNPKPKKRTENAKNIKCSKEHHAHINTLAAVVFPASRREVADALFDIVFENQNIVTLLREKIEAKQADNELESAA